MPQPSCFGNACERVAVGSVSHEVPRGSAPASTPPTRQVPAHTTTPPASSMRCRSSARLGLWSSLMGYAAGCTDSGCWVAKSLQ